MRLLFVLTVVLFASPSWPQCLPQNRVYNDWDADQTSSIAQAVFRCGGKTHIVRKWICRTDPAQEGTEEYDIEQQPCPGTLTEYEEIKRMQKNDVISNKAVITVNQGKIITFTNISNVRWK